MTDATCLLLFGTTTGTTRLLAMAVRKGLETAGLSVTLRNVRQASVDELQSHSLLMMGCSTWEDGALQRDFRDFLPRLGNMRLEGHEAAVFGPGSRSYSRFCKAVDVLELELLNRGAHLAGPSLRVDGTGYSARPQAAEWASSLARSLGASTGAIPREQAPMI
jgi:flavodoxin I